MTSQKDELTTDTSNLLVLGSSSAARNELLVSIGLVPDIIEKPEIDESLLPNETPVSYVRRMAEEKANSILSRKDSYLITADTVVVAGSRVLLKTFDEKTACNYLRMLSGRRHIVLTAFCVKHNDLLSLNLVKTTLKMKLLSEKEITDYIACREWVGSAGAYSIQGRAKTFFPFISGCFSNVVGLPIPKLSDVLKRMGFSRAYNEKRNNY